jgi:hypothetical protein
MAWIKKIQDSQGAQHEIDAKRWDGHDFSEVIDLVHGVVDTYVIPTSHSNLAGYADVVNSNSSSVEISQTNLKALVGFNKNDEGNDKIDAYDTFKIGDIILVEALSNDNTNKGEKAFDRWISAYNKSTDMFTLSVLETQVATHHHTITTTSSKALTSVTPVSTTIAMATTGTSVTVVTGKETTDITAGYDFITSIEHAGGNYSFNVYPSAATSTAVGHTHSIDSHSHSINLGHGSLVSTRVSAYTSLTSVNKTLHTHGSDVSVAVAPSTDTSATKIITGGSQTEVIVSLKDSDELATGYNKDALSTNDNSVGLSTDDISATTKTSSAGSHSHSVSAQTSESFVKTVTIAPSVVTSVSCSFTPPTVAPTVVTSVVRSITSEKTITEWSATVDSNTGVLSFTVSSANRLTNVTVSTSETGQDSGEMTLDAPRTAQSYTSSIVTATCTTGDSGSHTHGFSHTHTIPAHSHSIASHTHSYVKSVKDGAVQAYTSLTSVNKTLHTHGSNVSVAAAPSTDTSVTKIITGGSRTSVVEYLIADKDFTTSSEGLNVDTQYYDVDINYPGLAIKGRKFATTTVTPASATSVKPLTDITPSSADFVDSVTEKTSKNIGGE